MTLRIRELQSFSKSRFDKEVTRKFFAMASHANFLPRQGRLLLWKHDFERLHAKSQQWRELNPGI